MGHVLRLTFFGVKCHRNHGYCTTGDTVGEAWVRAWYLLRGRLDAIHLVHWLAPPCFGVRLCDRDVPRSRYFEKCCQLQLDCMKTQQPIHMPLDDAMIKSQAQYTVGAGFQAGLYEWPAIMRKWRRATAAGAK